VKNDYKITKEDLKKALSSPIRIKGMPLKGGIIKAVKETLGGEGLRVIEKESKTLGIPFIPEEIQEAEWYPAEVCEFKDSEVEGFLIIRIKDFKLHPLHFLYLGHFLLGITKLVKKFKEVIVKKTKSPFRGDKYQEYLIKWKH